MARPRRTDDEQAKRLTEVLRRRGVSMRCPACDWTLDGPLGDYELRPKGESILGERRSIKLMVYACRNCGYVRLHSANVLRDALPELAPDKS